MTDIHFPPCPKCGMTLEEGCTNECADEAEQRAFNEVEQEHMAAVDAAMMARDIAEDYARHLGPDAADSRSAFYRTMEAAAHSQKWRAYYATMAEVFAFAATWVRKGRAA